MSCRRWSYDQEFEWSGPSAIVRWMRVGGRLFAIATLAAAISTVARANPPIEGAPAAVIPPAPAPSTTTRALAAGATILPGLVLHGSGHFALGDHSTGARLLRWEGAGLAAIVAGIGGLAVTGASPRTVGVFIPLTVAGVGLFGMTWLSDAYGVLAPPGGRGEAPMVVPLVEAEAGARYIYDRVFAYRAFAVTAVDLRWRAFRVKPSAWVAVDHDNARLRLGGAYRFVGPRPDVAPAEDAGTANGSFVDLELAVTHHRYGAERFALTLGEASLLARLELRRIAPSLAGSFVEMGLGFAMGGVTYFRVTTDPTALLLARLGWGFFLGRAADRRGELLLYYDHRHDGFAAGLKLPGLGSGPAGHFGVRGLAYLSRRFGFVIDGQIGSAYVAGASLLIRHGGM